MRTQSAEGSSPEPIAGRLSRAAPDDLWKQLSAETIEVGRSVRSRGTLRRARLAAWRPARKARRPRARGTDRRGQIPHMTPSVARPAKGAPRTGPGHWEGDLLTGARTGSAVGTRVARPTRVVLLARREGPDATSARQGCTKTLRHGSALLRTTLPDDRGNERAEPEPLAPRRASQRFVADPSRPWPRGTKEHTHGLLRP